LVANCIDPVVNIQDEEASAEPKTELNSSLSRDNFVKHTDGLSHRRCANVAVLFDHLRTHRSGSATKIMPTRLRLTNVPEGAANSESINLLFARATTATR